MRVIQKRVALPDGREIGIETGRLAKQADGSVVVRQGDTMLLATVVSAQEAGEGVDFMPLSVDYRERHSAAGKIPGSFFRREMRPSDYEVLISRLVDRALRPLFPDDYHAETFVSVMLISAEPDIQPDSLAGLAASAALSVSDVPFNGPISEVRVARIDGEFVINPGYEEGKRADLDLMVGATYENILMVEGEMNEVSEDVMIEAIRQAHEAIKAQCLVQMELAKELGIEKREYCHEENDEEIRKHVRDFCYDRAYAIGKQQLPKKGRSEAFTKLFEELQESIPEERREELEFMLSRYYHAVEREAMRNLILDEQIRLDGRKTDEVRPIWCEVDSLPRAHGSAIFTRGETQALASVTLGTKTDEKLVDEALYSGTEQFMLHYNFPPFSTGEARPQRNPGRREIGHGNLALRALKNQVPLGDDQPYCIRIVSDILESNGSSSMATVCAGTLALMDAGVQMKKPLSGIAMGLISDTETQRYVVLSDILGDEDHLGDMDFKVTGTRDGITATQMDIKVDGLPYEVLKRALEQAKAGRLHILDKLTETLPAPRAEYKPHTPRCEVMTVPRDAIGAIIGPGGKVIQEMQRETGAKINIEEVENHGVVSIYGTSSEEIEGAKAKIRAIVAVPEVGEIYRGKVKTLVPFGAFIEIMPGKDGLLHVSEIDWKRVENVEQCFKVGDEVEVKLLEIDEKTGKLRLSRKALLPKPEGEKGERNANQKPRKK